MIEYSVGKNVMQKVKCFCCQKVLKYKPDGNPSTIVPLYDGLWFQASGNFGSNIFDPITVEEYIRIAICDECVLKSKKNVKHIYDIQHKTTSKERPSVDCLGDSS